MKKWLTRLLFDWVFVLLYKLFQAFLNLVDFIESFFDIFAGTAKVIYKGDSEFLINIFFGHSSVVNAFWAMALIAIVLAFGFCIVQVGRKAADVTGAVKQSVGQIMSSFFRCLLIILLLNLITAAAINITNVLLDRINYALKNAAVLNQEEADKTFSEQEYAAMTRILATVANYSVNPSADSRYNVNSCFNAIRPDLLSLYVNGFFRYDYDLDANGHYTWQGALALLAASSDLTTDLSLDVYYADVVNAFQVVSKELNTYRDFAPVERAHFSVPESIDTDVLIFLICGMNAAQNNIYNGSDFNDSLRKGYISGEKSYNNLTQVRKDFDIWEMDYLVGYISCLVFVIIMAICIFTFIVRMFNLLLLYLTAPLFASSMPMDDGGKWQSWTQAFVIQLFSGFGMVIAMRLYLIIIPIIISTDLVFFENVYLNRMAQLLMVLGGAWAVLQAGSVITGILAGNPGMAAIQQEGRIGAMVTGWAMRAPKAAIGATKSIAEAPIKAVAGGKRLHDKAEQSRQAKAEHLNRKALQRQNKADALFDKAERKLAAAGEITKKDSPKYQRMMDRAAHAQLQADKSARKAGRMQAKYGYGAYQSRPNYRGMAGVGDDSSSDFSEIHVPRSRPGSEGTGSSGVGFSEIQVSRSKPSSGSAQPGGVPPKAVSETTSDRAAGGASGAAGAAAGAAKAAMGAKPGAPAPSGRSGGVPPRTVSETTSDRAAGGSSGTSGAGGGVQSGGSSSGPSGGASAPPPPRAQWKDTDAGVPELHVPRPRAAAAPPSSPGFSEVNVTRFRPSSGSGPKPGGTAAKSPPAPPESGEDKSGGAPPPPRSRS